MFCNPSHIVVCSFFRFVCLSIWYHLKPLPLKVTLCQILFRRTIQIGIYCWIRNELKCHLNTRDVRNTHTHSYMSLFRSVTNRIRYFNFRHFPLPFGNPEFRWLPCYYEYKCVVEMKLNAILCNTMNVFTSTSPLGWTISICVDSFVHFYSTKSTNIGSAFMKHAFPLIKYQQTIFDIKLNVFFTCKLNIENSFSQCLRYRRI